MHRKSSVKLLAAGAPFQAPLEKLTALPRPLGSNLLHWPTRLLPVSMLILSLTLACDCALAYQILCKLDDRRWSYNIILILQDGDHNVANLFPVCGLHGPVYHLGMSKAIGIPNFDQISQSTAEIFLLPVSIVTFPL